MDRPVFLFPGQGAQTAGMGRDIYEAFPSAKHIFDAHPSVRDMCFNATEDQLKQTSLTQPTIYLLSMAIDSVLKENGISPVATAGHSLGEYPALASAGVMDISTGLKIVTERGRLMQEEGLKTLGTMAAVIGLDDVVVRDICARQSGVVEAVNFNAPGQVVISGDKEAVLKALPEFDAAGAAMVKELNVSGAFHSSLLKEAAARFKVFLGGFKYNLPEVGVVANVKADYYNGAQDIVELLSKQICAAVLWVDSMNKLISEGRKAFIEVGPGNVLKGLMRRIDKSVAVDVTSDVKGLQAVLTKYKG